MHEEPNILLWARGSAVQHIEFPWTLDRNYCKDPLAPPAGLNKFFIQNPSPLYCMYVLLIPVYSRPVSSDAELRCLSIPPGSGDCVSCGISYSPDEPCRTHTARHGGNAPGTTPAFYSIVIPFDIWLYSSDIDECCCALLVHDSLVCSLLWSTFRGSYLTSWTAALIRSSRLPTKSSTMLRRWRSKPN